MRKIKTNTDWWETVDWFFSDLLSLRRLFLSEVSESEFIELRMKRDNKLAYYLEEIWNNAPDVPNIHSLIGWDILCDLCSEAYVLYEGASK